MKPSRILPEGCIPQLEAMFHGKARSFDLKRELDGRFLEFTFAPIRSKKQVLVTIYDRTEQRYTALWMNNYARELEEVNRQMQQAQAHLVQSEKMASLGQLVAGIAHEINTPIGSINSNNDILIRSVSKMREFFNCEQCPVEVRENPDVVKLMRVLEEINQNNRIACDRIINIISSLRNFARLDEAERKRVNIHEGLDSSLILVHHQLKNRIEIVKDYGTLPEIECFPNQLNQVFMNLLVNAAQAIPGRGTLPSRHLARGQRGSGQDQRHGSWHSTREHAEDFRPRFHNQRRWSRTRAWGYPSVTRLFRTTVVESPSKAKWDAAPHSPLRFQFPSVPAKEPLHAGIGHHHPARRRRGDGVDFHQIVSRH